MRNWTRVLFVLALSLGGLAARPGHADTVADVRAKGYLACGVSEGLIGFSVQDANGQWQGMDADFCRAIAAAVLGDPAKVTFVPLSAAQRFTALKGAAPGQPGEVDVLVRNTSWTLERDAGLGVRFPAPYFYDGQAFMVRRNLGVESALELSGASICTATGTTSELNVADYFRTKQMPYEIIPFERAEDVVKAYDSGRCNVLSADKSGLASQRLKLTNPDDHMILPQIISKEPFSPVVREGDEAWFNVVRWVVFALINAEEMGVGQANLADMRGSNNPMIRRLLGLEDALGQRLGLDPEWAARAIAAVGHYGEIYERNVGEASALKIERGLNRLWSDGGALYAPPLR